MARKKLIIDEVFNACWTEHWNCEKFHRSGWAKEVKRLYENHIRNRFGKCTLSRILPSVGAWHKSMGDSPTTANRALEVFNRLFQFAKEKNWCDYTPNVKAFKEKKRKRYATETEIQKIGELLNENYISHPKAVTFIFALLFTGSRPRALERALWSELRILENGYGILEFDGKTGDETLVIPPFVLQLFQKLPSNVQGRIFNCAMPRRFWHKIRTEAGCPDLWARDLRRTFATVGLSNGIEVGIISELLNHKSTQTTKIYAKLMNDQRVQSVADINQKLVNIMGVKNGLEQNLYSIDNDIGRRRTS